VSGGTALTVAGEDGRPRGAGRLAAPLVAVAVTAAAALVAWGLWGFSYDDAFITYRYAANLVAGRGLVFNPGEAVLGTTAPGWAVLLAAATRAGHAVGLGSWDAAAWGTLLSVLSLAVVTGFLPLAVLRRAPPPWPWAFPLLFTLLAFTQPWCLQMLGAETYPVLALGTVAAWLALAPREGRQTAAGTDEPAGHEIAPGLLMALAMTLRLDAAAGALAIGVVLWTRRRRPPWRYGAAGLLPLLPWLAWLEGRFGTVVPATLAAKRSESAGGGLLAYSRAEWHWLHRDLPRASALWLGVLAAAGAAWLAWSLWRVVRHRRHSGAPAAADPGARRTADTPSPLLPFLPLLLGLLSWVVLQELAYRLVGVPFAPWYHLHLVLTILALAVAAGLELGRATTPGRRGRAVGGAVGGAVPRRGGLYTVALTILLLAPVAIPGALYLAGTWRQPPDGRLPTYRAVGRYLSQTAPPGATVAAVEIGVLAYSADRPVLDLVGLVDPAVVAARRDGRLAALVTARQPRYLLAPPQFWPDLFGPLLADPAIGRHYRPVAFFTAESFAGGTVTLYERHPLRFAAAPPAPPG